MKKLFMMAAVAVMCLTGCNKANTAEESLNFEKATPEAVVSALAEKVQAGDATAVTTALESVQAQLTELVNSGNVEKVTEYAAKIKAFVEDNAEALKGFNIDVTPLTSVIDKVAALPTGAEEAAQDAIDEAQDAVESAAEEAVDAAKAKAEETVDAAKAKAEEAVDAAKAKANEAVEAAKAKANEAVEEGKAKTNNAIQNAADKIKL